MISSISEYIQLWIYSYIYSDDDNVVFQSMRSSVLHERGERHRGRHHRNTRVPQIWSITLVMLLIATLFVAARIYTRRNSGIKTVGFDDLMILLALTATSTCGGLGLWAATLGFGTHEWDIIDDCDAPKLYNLQFACMLIPAVYQVSLACVQLSLLTFYARFFKHLRFTSFSLMAIIVTFCTVVCLGNFFHCRPKRDALDHFCEDHLAVIWYFSSGVGLLLDIIIWSLPLPKLLKLRSISRRKKFGIIATFGVGASAVIVSISRMTIIAVGASNEDKYWHMARLHIYNQIEVGFGIACACMPSLMPLLRRYLKWKKSRGGIWKRRNHNVPEEGIQEDPAGPVILKNNVLESNFVERDAAGRPITMRVIKHPLGSRERISVADISGCGILDSPLVVRPPEQCTLHDIRVQDHDGIPHAQQTQSARRVGDWIELSPMMSIAESTKETTDFHEDTNLPRHPPEIHNNPNRISSLGGSIPGAKMIRRASSQFRGLFRFSPERPHEPSIASAPAGPVSGLSSITAVEHSFLRSSPNHATRDYATLSAVRPLGSSNSGAPMLFIGTSPHNHHNHHHQQQQQQQQQHSTDHNHNHPTHLYHGQSSYSANSIDTDSIETATTDTQYQYQSPSASASSAIHISQIPSHTTPLSPRTSQLRNTTPWRDTIYPNPVEDQRGMLGLGDVDPVEGRILQLERVETVDSQFFQRS